MRMTRRLAIVIAFVCAALAAVLTLFFLRSVEQRAAPREAAKNVEVVMPLRDITAGTIVRSEMLGTTKVPEDEVPAGAVRSPTEISGQVAQVDLVAGQAITRSQVQSPTQLSYHVPDGMRAVTVAIDPVVGVAGFLKPGDRVDVIATFEIGEVTITRTVLQNVKLLALGTTTTAAKPKRRPAEGEEAKVEAAEEKEQPNATLAVNPEQAQTLILSDARGKLRLALRPKFEDQYIALAATDTAKVIGEEFEEVIAAQEQPKPEVPGPGVDGAPPQGAPGATLTREPRGPAVEVIRGTERKTVIIGGSQTSSSARGGQ